jgi:hypothetical protein
MMQIAAIPVHEGVASRAARERKRRTAGLYEMLDNISADEPAAANYQAAGRLCFL